MNDEQVKDLKEKILDIEDKLDEFVEEMQEKIATLKGVLRDMEKDRAKAKDYER